MFYWIIIITIYSEIHLHHSFAPSLNNLFEIINSGHNLRNKPCAITRKNKNIGHHSFDFRGLKFWNTFPNSIKFINNTNNFKIAIHDNYYKFIDMYVLITLDMKSEISLRKI